MGNVTNAQYTLTQMCLPYVLGKEKSGLTSQDGWCIDSV